MRRCGCKSKKRKKKKVPTLATTTESMLNFSCFLNTKCHIGLHVRALSGKYLLFYLLQRRLLNGTLHRLLLDGLHHLLRQRDILQNTNPPTISTCTTASLVMVRMTSWRYSSGFLLTSNFSGPYLASCRARPDLKGVGVQGDDSMIERQMFGVLNLREEKRDSCL